MGLFIGGRLQLFQRSVYFMISKRFNLAHPWYGNLRNYMPEIDLKACCTNGITI